MLSYLLHTLPHNFKTILSTKPIAQYSTGILTILAEYNDIDNILLILRSTQDINIEAPVYLTQILSTYDVSLFRYQQISNIIYDDIEYLTPELGKLLYCCWCHTKDISRAILLNSFGVRHLLEEPITTIVLDDFVYSTYNGHSYRELMFIFNHLSEQDKYLIRNEIPIGVFLTNMDLLRAVLPYYQVGDQDHIVAYALVHNSIYPITSETLFPTEYIIARKYTNWNGELITDSHYNLSLVLRRIITEEDGDNVKYVLSSLSDAGHNIEKYRAYM